MTDLNTLTPEELEAIRMLVAPQIAARERADAEDGKRAALIREAQGEHWSPPSDPELDARMLAAIDEALRVAPRDKHLGELMTTSISFGAGRGRLESPPDPESLAAAALVVRADSDAAFAADLALWLPPGPFQGVSERVQRISMLKLCIQNHLRNQRVRADWGLTPEPIK